MKVRFNFSFLTILTFLVWLICIYKFYIDFDRKNLFDDLIHSGLLIIAIILSLLKVYSDWMYYKEQKSLISFMSTFIIILCMAVFLVTLYFLNKQDKTPTVLYAIRNRSSWGNFSIDFRENGTYKYGTYGFMSESYKRGHYTMRDSIIYLDKTDIVDDIVSDRMLLKTIPKNDSIVKNNNSLLKLIFGKAGKDTLPDTYLFQINQDGQIIESSMYFKVLLKNI